MKILDNYKPVVPYGNQDALQIKKSGLETKIKKNLIREHYTELYLNGEFYAKILCTAELLVELGLGRLCCDGLLRIETRVKCVWVNEDGSRIDVITDQEVEEILELRQAPDSNWKNERIFTMAKMFYEDTPLHRMTASAHSCYLWQQKGDGFWCEDIGRYNTLDKVVGYALKNRIYLGACAIYLSSRISADMMIKIIRVGIPLVVSKTFPTLEAVTLAERYGVTLIGGSSSTEMIQFTQKVNETGI